MEKLKMAMIMSDVESEDNVFTKKSRHTRHLKELAFVSDHINVNKRRQRIMSNSSDEDSVDNITSQLSSFPIVPGTLRSTPTVDIQSCSKKIRRLEDSPNISGRSTPVSYTPSLQKMKAIPCDQSKHTVKYFLLIIHDIF